jgi:hypothetical protein
MKEEVLNITNQEVNQYIADARVLRSKEFLRLLGLFFGLPIRLLSRFSMFKIASAKASVEGL